MLRWVTRKILMQTKRGNQWWSCFGSNLIYILEEYVYHLHTLNKHLKMLEIVQLSDMLSKCLNYLNIPMLRLLFMGCKDYQKNQCLLFCSIFLWYRINRIREIFYKQHFVQFCRITRRFKSSILHHRTIFQKLLNYFKFNSDLVHWNIRPTHQLNPDYGSWSRDKKTFKIADFGSIGKFCLCIKKGQS